MYDKDKYGWHKLPRPKTRRGSPTSSFVILPVWVSEGSLETSISLSEILIWKKKFLYSVELKYLKSENNILAIQSNSSRSFAAAKIQYST